jgi:hypothetical protein
LGLNSLEEQALQTCPRGFELALGEAVTAIQLGNCDLVCAAGSTRLMGATLWPVIARE